ncbi:unnamed protein product [Rotaria sordida]|uniref:aromatase n=1 Tax=Rotaria sordida TaxID=392033 RepID=A0A818YAZ9_9BILA|nr:unnamed protein product [Rotaria sordida]
MMYKCSFNDIHCSVNDFVPFTSFLYGACYTFNAALKNNTNRNILYANEYGGDGKLSIGLYIHSHQYVLHLPSGFGAIALVHGNTQLPNIEAAGIELAPGQRHKLGYKKKTTYLLPSPYTPCTKKISPNMQAMFEYYNNTNYGYSEMLCYQLCGQVYAYCSECLQECAIENFIIQTSSLSQPGEWEMEKIKQFVENSTIPLATNWSCTWQDEIRKNYLTINVVRETIPVASQYYTSKYGDIVQINLFNQPTIIISNPDFADYILRRNGKNYTLRFGNSLGLEYLGMKNKGIIWNRNIQRWKYQRLNFFQKALNNKLLDDAKYVSNDATDYVLKHLDKYEIETNIIDTMDLLRSITFTITCHLFLDLPIGIISIEKTKYYVNSIVQYFKAWEYFLLKPTQIYDKKQTNKHQKSIKQLNNVVNELISKRVMNNNCLFINSLLNALNNQQITKEEMNQCILEMLIAGTDTSSVTMFYFLLALCDRKELEEQLLKELKENSYQILINGLKESMRFKPVGPVIMRCTINDDIYNNTHIKNGTNIIINLVDMHRRNEYFVQGNQFNLINVEDKDLSNTNNEKNVFLPFGIGPKECVGRWLAKVEMEIIIEQLILNYSFKRANGTKTLEELQTRWDIAQQPTDPGYMLIQKR